MITNQGKEKAKPITRVLSATLGTFFLIAPIIVGITNTRLVEEILASSFAVMVLAVIFILIEIVLGIVFLKVGYTGSTPSWLKLDIDLK